MFRTLIEFRQRIIKELIKNSTAVYRQNLEQLEMSLKSIENPNKKLGKRRIISNNLNETLQTPRLEPISSLHPDPILAKYLTASCIPRKLESPEMEKLNVHKKYAEQKAKFNPAELETPDEVQVPSYFPLDIGLFSPVGFFNPEGNTEKNQILETLQSENRSFTGTDLKINAPPSREKETLKLQIRSLWLYLRTLKRLNPTFHTLKARKAITELQSEEIVETFLRVKNTSKFFLNWKISYVNKFLAVHLNKHQALVYATKCFSGFKQLLDQNKDSDSQADSYFQSKLKQKVLLKWTSAGVVSETVAASFRLKRAMMAWKEYQFSVAQKLISIIKARKAYHQSLLHKGFRLWSKLTLLNMKQTMFSELRIKAEFLRFWRKKLKTRLLLKRVISLGLENYKDEIISQLRSDANLLTQILDCWKKLSCRKRKSKNQQVKTLTAQNWRQQQIKVRIFFNWREKVNFCKGVKILQNHLQKVTKVEFRRWKEVFTHEKSEKLEIEKYHSDNFIRRLLSGWSEWALQEKVIRAIRRKKILHHWKSAIYQLTISPLNYNDRTHKRKIFTVWKNDYKMTKKETILGKKFAEYQNIAIVNLKNRIFRKFIENVRNQGKIRKLSKFENIGKNLIKFHHFLRKFRRFVHSKISYQNLKKKAIVHYSKQLKKLSNQEKVQCLKKPFQALKNYTAKTKSIFQTLQSVVVNKIRTTFRFFQIEKYEKI